MPGPQRITLGRIARPADPVLERPVTDDTLGSIGKGLGALGEFVGEKAKKVSSFETARAVGSLNKHLEEAQTEIMTHPDATVGDILSRLHTNTETIRQGLTGAAADQFETILAEQGGAASERLKQQKLTSDAGRAFSAAKGRVAEFTEAQRQGILEADANEIDIKAVDEKYRASVQQVEEGLGESPIARAQFRQYLAEHGPQKRSDLIEFARNRRTRLQSLQASVVMSDALAGINKDNFDERSAMAGLALASVDGLSDAERATESASWKENAGKLVNANNELAINQQYFAVLQDRESPPEEKVALLTALSSELVNKYGKNPDKVADDLRIHSERIHTDSINGDMEKNPVGVSEEILMNPDYLARRKQSETFNENKRSLAKKTLHDEFAGKWSEASINFIGSPTPQQTAQMINEPWTASQVQSDLYQDLETTWNAFDRDRSLIAMADGGQALIASTENHFQKKMSELSAKIAPTIRGAGILSTAGHADLSPEGKAAVNAASDGIVRDLMNQFRSGAASLISVEAQMMKHVRNARFLPNAWKNEIDSMFNSGNMNEKVQAAALYNSAVEADPSVAGQFDNAALMKKLFQEANTPGFNAEEASRRLFTNNPVVADKMAQWAALSDESKLLAFKGTSYLAQNAKIKAALDNNYFRWQREVERQIASGKGAVSATEAMEKAREIVEANPDPFAPKAQGDEAEAQINEDKEAFSATVNGADVRTISVVDPLQGGKVSYILEHLDSDSGEWKPRVDANGFIVPVQVDPTKFPSVKAEAEERNKNEADASGKQARRAYEQALIYNDLKEFGFSDEALAVTFPGFKDGFSADELAKRKAALPPDDGSFFNAKRTNEANERLILNKLRNELKLLGPSELEVFKNDARTVIGLLPDKRKGIEDHMQDVIKKLKNAPRVSRLAKTTEEQVKQIHFVIRRLDFFGD